MVWQGVNRELALLEPGPGAGRESGSVGLNGELAGVGRDIVTGTDTEGNTIGQMIERLRLQRGWDVAYERAVQGI